MYAYLRGLFVLALASTLAENLTPNDAGYKKHLHHITSLVLIIAILSPLSNYVKFFYDLPFFEQGAAGEESNGDQFNKIVIAEIQAQLENNAARAINSRFSVPLDSITVHSELNAEDVSNIIIEKITVKISSLPLPLNSKTVADYLSDLFSCECEVIVSSG